MLESWQQKPSLDSVPAIIFTPTCCLTFYPCQLQRVFLGYHHHRYHSAGQMGKKSLFETATFSSLPGVRFLSRSHTDFCCKSVSVLIITIIIIFSLADCRELLCRQNIVGHETTLFVADDEVGGFPFCRNHWLGLKRAECSVQLRSQCNLSLQY